jgi:hypothetical protein
LISYRPDRRPRFSPRRLLVRTTNLATVFALAAAVSCGPEVTEITVDPGLVRTKMSAGGVGVCGVTSVADMPHDHNVSPDELAELLLSVLAEKMGEDAIYSPETIRTWQGEETYQEVLDRYATDGAIDTGLLPGLATDLDTRMRYLVLPRITRDSVHRAVPEVEEEEDPFEENGENTTKYTFRITRILDVSIHVYDLESGTTVWSGVISEQDARSTSRREDEIDNDLSWEVHEGFWADLFGSFFRWLFRLGPGNKPPDELYPSPPGVHAILRSVFEAFADAIPAELG